MAASDQKPIGSGFHAKSTAAEVVEGIDLSGKNIIVTGGYSGIGLETVRALTGAGADGHEFGHQRIVALQHLDQCFEFIVEQNGGVCQILCQP